MDKFSQQLRRYQTRAMAHRRHQENRQAMEIKQIADVEKLRKVYSVLADPHAETPTEKGSSKMKRTVRKYSLGFSQVVDQARRTVSQIPDDPEMEANQSIKPILSRDIVKALLASGQH